MDAGALLDLLGNENRRRILRLLSHKPCYVTEISEHLGVSPKAVIDHLRKLEDTGLIESHTDNQRRKYFRIAENIRLEVTVAPYSFGMKSAYPASPSLDLSSCQHISVEVRESARANTNLSEIAASSVAGESIELTGTDIVSLAEELDRLREIERELSLAQRWVQGKIAGALNQISEYIEDDGYLTAEILAAIARGSQEPDTISSEVEIPPSVVEEHLQRLSDRGIVRHDSDKWKLPNQ